MNPKEFLSLFYTLLNFNYNFTASDFLDIVDYINKKIQENNKAE